MQTKECQACHLLNLVPENVFSYCRRCSASLQPESNYRAVKPVLSTLLITVFILVIAARYFIAD